MKTKALLILTALVLTTSLLVGLPQEKARAVNPVLYAAPTAVGAGNCSDWANACALYTALGMAVSGDEIWVKAGVHYPAAAPDTNRLATFTLKDGVHIMGGFSGTETTSEQRDWRKNLTILSGDLDMNDLNTDGNFIAETTADIRGINVYHVVTGGGVTYTGALDGLIITAGLANGGGENNMGGGMYNYNSTPFLLDVVLIGNYAHGNGGGMYNNLSDPILINTKILGNQAHSSGGGMTNQNSSPVIMNALFARNDGGMGGGAMQNMDSNPVLTNVTISHNQSDDAGGMVNYFSNPKITNVIMWDNVAPTHPEINNISGYPVITRSDIEGCGGTAAWNPECGPINMGNIDADPLFIDPAADNYHLALNSPAIDAGDNSALFSYLTWDLDDSPRYVDIPGVPDTGFGTSPFVDMGAYEVQFYEFFLPLIAR